LGQLWTHQFACSVGRHRMGAWFRKLKGLLGLGSIGGILGAVFGGLWWLIEGMVGVPGFFAGTLGWTIGIWSGFGAVATSGAGLLLATLGRVPALERLSPTRMFGYGALAGALAPTALLVIVGMPWSLAFAVLAGVSGLFGGLAASGLVIVAKQAPDTPLAEGSELGALGSGAGRV